MVEVKITYETLFDFLRREKSRNELQQLDKTFYKDVVEYLKEKKSTIRDEDHHTLLFSKSEQEKIKIQIKNIQKILRELYELREKKVINLATNKVRTESNLVDISNLLPEEMSLFNDACSLMIKYKEGVLNRVLTMELPLSDLKTEMDYSSKSSIMTNEDEEENESKKYEEAEETNIPEKEQAKEDIFDAYKKKLDEAREKKGEQIEIHHNRSTEKLQRVKILNDLPKFMGQDKNIYGPFKKDDLTELPDSIITILLKKGRVELI